MLGEKFHRLVRQKKSEFIRLSASAFRPQEPCRLFYRHPLGRRDAGEALLRHLQVAQHVLHPHRPEGESLTDKRLAASADRPETFRPQLLSLHVE